MLTTLALGMATVLSAATPTMETIRLPLAQDSAQYVALHCLSPSPNSRQSGPARSVLFIHGSSFPTMLAFGFEFAPGDSWMFYMADRGYLACGLDFLGYGASSRPPALMSPPQDSPPIDRAPQVAQQIALAVDYMRQEMGMSRVNLVAHSSGTVPAAMYASQFPSNLASLTLFGPVVPKPGALPEKVDFAWFKLSPQTRYEQLKFTRVLPKGMHLLEPAVSAKWAEEFAASAPTDAKTVDGDLRIPAGPLADLNSVEAGIYPYAPDKVICPVFVVHGDHDSVVDATGAATFLTKFTASPLRWLLQIDHGSHVMHLEKNRHSLYASVYAFIQVAGAEER